MAFWRRKKTGADKGQAILLEHESRGESGAKKGEENFPLTSRFAEHMQTRKLNEVLSTGVSVLESRWGIESWREAVVDKSNGRWTILQHQKRPRHTTPTEDSEGLTEEIDVLKTGCSYKEALESLLVFEQGMENLSALPESQYPDNYFIDIAEYDGIVLADDGCFYPTQNGKVLVSGRFDADALKRIAGKTKISTEALRKGFSFDMPPSSSLSDTYNRASYMLCIKAQEHIAAQMATEDEGLIKTFEEYLEQEEKLQNLLSIQEEIQSSLKKLTATADYAKSSDAQPKFAGSSWGEAWKELNNFSFYCVFRSEKTIKETIETKRLYFGGFFSEQEHDVIQRGLQQACHFALAMDMRLTLGTIAGTESTSNGKSYALGRMKELKNHLPYKVPLKNAVLEMAASDMPVCVPRSVYLMQQIIDHAVKKLSKQLEQARQYIAGDKASACTPEAEDRIYPHQAVAVEVPKSKQGFSYRWNEARKQQNEENGEESWVLFHISYDGKHGLLEEKSDLVFSTKEDAKEFVNGLIEVNKEKILDLVPLVSVFKIMKQEFKTMKQEKDKDRQAMQNCLEALAEEEDSFATLKEPLLMKNINYLRTVQEYSDIRERYHDVGEKYEEYKRKARSFRLIGRLGP